MPLMQKCCGCFNLRQGAVIIAMAHLLLSAIGLFCLVLGFSHAQDMARMLEDDKRQDEQDLQLDYHHHNQKQFEQADRYAYGIIILMYTLIAVVTIYLISSILLLYGALMRIRQFMLPWISIGLIGLSGFFVTLIASQFFMDIRSGTSVFAAGILVLTFATYMWIIVFSYYQKLYELEMTAGTIIRPDVTAVKSGYMHFGSKPYNV